ncbi:hypothetical protein [Oceanihabitans sediminis]|uniref:hypothetical protein n=1 Tax=Oceanihabitans sediminis TaxID=1812012 RepID=UPI00299EAC1A|nr:hypothetical protein [Oceanihabitans sediminis]MDX1279383.1 hypothetical protein [Oceanihabitans sediminis]
MDNEKEFILHNDCIKLYNNRLYSNIFTDENIVSKKKVIKYGSDQYYGYYMEKGRDTYFCPDLYADLLPFKINETHEIDYRGDVFKILIEVPTTIQIPTEQRLTWNKLLDVFCAFKHTNPLHQRLYNNCILASWVDRINFRASTEAGFGKDSASGIIAELVNSMANIYGASFAKLEYLLKNKLIILNEMGNLKKDEKQQMQEFLLAVGDYSNKYVKRTRKTNLTQEEYDISRTSLVIFSNLPHYYINKGQEYFDQMFTEAVTDRFIPFVFEGRLATKFGEMQDPTGIVDNYEEVYKDVIATLNYYRENPITEIKYKVPDTIKFSDDQMTRAGRTFYTILKYIGEDAETQEEFDEMATTLYSAYKKYGEVLKGSQPTQDILR